MAEVRWTDEQLRVILENRHTLLAASAGTGKTRTIIGKIGWLLGIDIGSSASGEPIDPAVAPCGLDEVAAITFTEKAACELRERLRDLVMSSGDADRLRWQLDRASVGTIHGFAATLLRVHALRLGIDPTFRILDEAEATLRQGETIRGVLVAAASEAGEELAAISDKVRLDGEGRRPGLAHLVSLVVRDLRWHADRYGGWSRPATTDSPPVLDPERLALLARERELEMDASDVAAIDRASGLYVLARRSLAAWLHWMEAENVRDFDSLILDARRLLTRPEHRSALVAIRKSLRLLVIDEFQDTDGAQRDIAFALAGIGDPDAVDCPQLLLVGDPKQSIFSFRGADIGVWNEVRSSLAGEGCLHALSVNFRAQPGIVGFSNAVSASAIGATGREVASHDPLHAIDYQPLVPWRHTGIGQGVDWLDCSAPDRASVEELEARLMAGRIRSLLSSGRVPAGASGEVRSVRPSDIAVLGRTRKALDRVDDALREAGVPVYNASRLGLAERSEVRDMVTLLHLLADPENDLHTLAFLRSPFVGLRDEVIARIRLAAPRPGPLLRQAEWWMARVLDGTESWFEAPEHPAIAVLEHEALTRALEALDHALALVDRAPPRELVEELLQVTRYRLHLGLREGVTEALAALERFKSVLEAYRHLSLRGFLDLWDRWGALDLGIGESSAHGAAGDVVTLQTIHTAKGLEWPVVALAGAGTWNFRRDRYSGEYLSDRELGPVLMPSTAERGPRASLIAARAAADHAAEEARLLYVALTRAADRLIIAAPGGAEGYMEFLQPELAGAVAPHQAIDEGERRGGRSAQRSGGSARLQDPGTGTGRQIEAFEGAGDQLDIFAHAGDADPGSGTGLVPVVFRSPEPLQASFPVPRVTLEWLDAVEAREPLPATSVIEAGVPLVTSASELQLSEADPDAWRLRYVHGVEETERFVPAPGARGVPATLRGVLIHGVLEKIRSVEEIARILDEAIVAVDAPPGTETLLSPGAPYRDALEREIARVVEGPRWQSYVDGEHYRELRFLVPCDGRWRLGAIDLYRPHPIPRVIDFKTHMIGANEAPNIAEGYRVQGRVYREAVATVTGREPTVHLHFTHPDVVVDL